MKIYIAGPYMYGDQVINTRNAILAGEEVIKLGHIPYIPHLNHLWHLVAPHPRDFWCEYDLHWVRLCDALWRLPGVSPGANAEVALALELSHPVFFSLADIENFYFLSNCCRAPIVSVFSDLPDFVGSDIKSQKIGTGWYECTSCNEPCDIFRPIKSAS